jgi:hypothetical protein
MAGVLEGSQFFTYDTLYDDTRTAHNISLHLNANNLSHFYKEKPNNVDVMAQALRCIF